jgi:large subunit ribosomal protein L24
MTSQKKSRIRKDDTVLVITGNNRGKTGQVFRVDGDRIYIQGVNVRKKHVKATRTMKGGIVDREMPVHRSNVRVCVDGKPIKLRARFNQQGQKELYYKDGSRAVEYRVLGPK